MKAIKSYLLHDAEILRDVVCEINSWNGALEYLEVFPNDEEFFEVYFNGNAMEAVRASYFGDYHYSDDYVCFNGYGNLVSYDEFEYRMLLADNIDDIIENLVDNYYNLYITDELNNLIEEYLNE